MDHSVALADRKPADTFVDLEGEGWGSVFEPSSVSLSIAWTSAPRA